MDARTPLPNVLDQAAGRSACPLRDTPIMLNNAPAAGADVGRTLLSTATEVMAAWRSDLRSGC